MQCQWCQHKSPLKQKRTGSFPLPPTCPEGPLTSTKAKRLSPGWREGRGAAALESKNFFTGIVVSIVLTFLAGLWRGTDPPVLTDKGPAEAGPRTRWGLTGTFSKSHCPLSLSSDPTATTD